jgi:hypothetical protein
MGVNVRYGMFICGNCEVICLKQDIRNCHCRFRIERSNGEFVRYCVYGGIKR